MGSIYLIRNTVNGKSYIGQTRHDAEKTRIRDHLTGKGKGNRLVKSAVEKYGKENFTYEILHDGIIPEFLDTLEIEAIEKFNTVSPHGYNLRAGGGGGSLSEETRRKLSETNKGKKRSKETRQKISETLKANPTITRGMLGKIHSAETRRKMSEVRRANPKKGMLGKTHSTETRRKISEASSKRQLGKTHSTETRRKISEAHKGEKNHRFSPMHLPTKEFYFSLPSCLGMKEKRRRVRTYCGKDSRTVYRWVRQWESEKA